MSIDQIIIILIIFVALANFILGYLRYDLVAICALILAIILGVVSPDKAFEGFGHPATITVATVLILSRALSNSGAVTYLTKLLEPLTKTKVKHIASYSLVSAALSSFMNNIGALSLMLPAAVQSALNSKRSPSIILMPLSFASILGGLITLIGTPPNIIIANYRQTISGEPFKMFDFTPVGFAVALCGVVFLIIIGWRLIPKARRPAELAEALYQIEAYVTEVHINGKGEIIGKTISELENTASEEEISIIGLVRTERRMFSDFRNQPLMLDDILIIEGSPDSISRYSSIEGFDLIGTDKTKPVELNTETEKTFEAVITPQSIINNQNSRMVGFTGRFGVNLLAISRQGKPIRERLRQVRFKPGDVLLLQGPSERSSSLITSLGLLPLAQRKITSNASDKSLITIFTFAASIIIASLGILPLPIAFAAAAICVVLFGIVPLHEMYESIDWPIIVLLAAMIPLGTALESTGATALLVSNIAVLGKTTGPIFMLVIILIITMTLSDVMNNAATAVVTAPIAYGIANELGVNSDPFLMAVAVGASCAFLTPIGHQNNTLILGPGGYHFGDYWRLGLPLEIIVTIVAIPSILIFWPL